MLSDQRAINGPGGTDIGNTFSRLLIHLCLSPVVIFLIRISGGNMNSKKKETACSSSGVTVMS